MKGHIKKLVLPMIITVIATFILAATVPAGEPYHHHRALRGQYGATGGGTSILAPLGFGSNLTPNGPPGAYVSQTCSVEGVYTFEPNGTGSFEGLFHCTTLSYTTANPNPPPPTITHPSSAGSAIETFLFHYTVAADGKITITQDPGTHVTEWTSGPSAGQTIYSDGLPLTGFITPDGKTITLTMGAPSVLSYPGGVPPTLQLIINSSSVLIYLHD